MAFLSSIVQRGKKKFAKTVFSFPFVSSSDPREKITDFKAYCQEISDFKWKSDVSDWYLKIRPTEKLERKVSIGLDAAEQMLFQQSAARFQCGYQCEIPEVFVAGVERARIYPKDFLITSFENHIFLDSALGSKEVLEQAGILETIFPPRVKYLKGEHLLLASPWSDNNYFHWLIDALPRLSLLEKICSHDCIPLIVPNSLKSFHIQSLQAAGIEESRLTRLEGKCFQVDRLIYPGLLSRTGNPSPHAINWLRKRFHQYFVPGTAKRRLYISRRDSSRKIINENEVFDFLRHYDFEFVCPWELSFLEQIKLFSTASIVLGPHGAAFTNMTFAPKNAALIELFGSSYINGCFWALSNIRGQKHAFLTSPTDTLDYYVSTTRLEALLRKSKIV